MKVAKPASLYSLRGTLQAQAQYYQERMDENRKAKANPKRYFSLSFLEGEYRAFESCLQAVNRAIDELGQIITEVESD